MAADPQNTVLLKNLIGAMGTLGNAHASAGNAREAVPWYRQGSELAQQLSARLPGEHAVIRQAAAVQQALGAVLVKTGERQEAAKWLRSAAGLYAGLIQAEPRNVDDLHGIAMVLAAQGELRLRAGDPIAAEELTVQADTLCRQVISVNRSAENLELLAEIDLQRAQASWRLHRAWQARRALCESLDLLHELKRRGDLKADSEGDREVLPAVEKLLREIPEKGGNP